MPYKDNEKRKRNSKEYYLKNKESYKEYYLINKKYIRKYQRKHYQKNKEIILLQQRKRYKEYYLKNRRKILERKKEYNNKKEILERKKKYQQKYQQRYKNKIKIHRKEYRRKIRQMKIPKNIMDDRMRKIIYSCLKGQKAGRKWESLVGYTRQDLIQHLEKQFDKEMTWQNYGSYWHLDHIVPKSWFPYQTAEEQAFKDCWALANLQPLEAKENILKGNKYVLTRALCSQGLPAKAKKSIELQKRMLRKGNVNDLFANWRNTRTGRMDYRTIL